MEAALSYLREELAKLRGSRPQSTLLEDLDVFCYSATYKLKELASLSVMPPHTILIQPWDKTILDDIQRAISSSPLHFSSAVEKDHIRVSLPPLSEERRQEIVKILRQKREEVRISVRRARDDSWEEVREMERRGEASEDEKFRAKDELQKLVDEYNRKVDELADAKEKEVMTV